MTRINIFLKDFILNKIRNVKIRNTISGSKRLAPAFVRGQGDTRTDAPSIQGVAQDTVPEPPVSPRKRTSAASSSSGMPAGSSGVVPSPSVAPLFIGKASIKAIFRLG